MKFAAYFLLYLISNYLFRHFGNDPTNFNSFLTDLCTPESIELTRTKRFKNKAYKILKFISNLLLNKHSYRALLITFFAISASEVYFKPNLLIVNDLRKAISHGIYSTSLLEYLKANPALLKIAADSGTVDLLDKFRNLTTENIQDLVLNINNDTRFHLLKEKDASVIPRQIIAMITICFINGQISDDQYLKDVLKFLAGQKIRPELKELLKIIIDKYNIMFLSSFFDL